MNAKTIVTVCLLAVSAAPALRAGQDSVKAIILSPRVGMTLSGDECRKYHFFGNIPRLIDATFMKIGASVYAARVRSLDASGVLCDSLVRYSRQMLQMYGERINHLDEIKRASYFIGTDPVELTEVSYANAGPMPAFVASSQGPIDPEPSPELQLQLAEHRRRSLLSYDLLPLGVGQESDEDPDSPVIGIGGGIAFYEPDFSGLNRAFTAIEDTYRAEGNNIPYQGPAFDDRTVKFFSMLCTVSPRFALILEGGSTGEHTVSMVDGLIAYTYPLVRRSILKCSGAAGVVHVKVDAHKYYGAGLPSRGEYVSLDEISVSGSSTGIMLRGTFGLKLGSVVGLEVFGQYLAVPAVTYSSDRYQPAHLKLSGAGFGMKVYFLYF